MTGAGPLSIEDEGDRMTSLFRTLTLAAALLLAVPFAASAGDQPADAPAAAQPCPYATGEGGCCGGACMQQQGDAKPAAAPMPADCPCQKRAKAAAAAKAAEAAQHDAH
jgi:hypothetical protein